ncbi:unnamed protein product [Calicophoron daubneyi]|uniref:Uncharacterized protein n=1 Tax=Calicophoron daubneyi TaxID=300641 RepID=A0AAV2T4A9_CALDB
MHARVYLSSRVSTLVVLIRLCRMLQPVSLQIFCPHFRSPTHPLTQSSFPSVIPTMFGLVYFPTAFAITCSVFLPHSQLPFSSLSPSPPVTPVCQISRRQI